MKVCPRCSIQKRQEDFYKRTLAKDGLDYQCKDCIQKYRELHSAKIKESKARYRLEKPTDPAIKRTWYLKTRYGITPEQFDDLLLSQAGRCGICKTSEPKGCQDQWAIDHDHVTGQIRGLLCERCNVGIGNLKDDPKLLQRAIDYLNNPPALIILGEIA